MKLQHSFIGTEHLLYGLAAEEGPPGDRGIASQVLAMRDITPDRIENEILKTIGMSGVATSDNPPFTPRAKKVLELSLREALQLGHSYIGTEHLLLGLIREGEGVGAMILQGFIELSELRKDVIRAMGGTRAPDPPVDPALVIDDDDRNDGVWMVWEYSMPSYPFPTEIEALRFAQEQNVKDGNFTVYVEFVKWGERPG